MTLDVVSQSIRYGQIAIHATDGVALPPSDTRGSLGTVDTPLQALIKACIQRLERDAAKAGQPFVLRRFEADHGINNGTLGQLRSGKRKSVDPPTAAKISRALGITLEELSEAIGRAATTPTPPPASAVVETEVVDDEHTSLIDAASDKTRHTYSDGRAVLALLQQQAAFPRENADQIAMVRAWLDAAARLRERGEKRTPGRIIAEVTRRLVEVEQRAAEVNERARESARARGYEPPEVPPPSVQALKDKKAAGR